MLQLSSETRISELQGQSQAMTDALISTGIFRNGDNADVTIDELCRDYGLNPLILLNILTRAQAAEAPSTIDISELDNMTLAQVVDNIESAHHAYLREVLPAIRGLAARVVAAHGTRDSRLLDVEALFNKMAADLEHHLDHEEEALFPMVRDLETDGAVRPTRCGDSVGGPIACMENDHELTKKELGHLSELTDNYAVPENACGTYQRFLEALRQFSENTFVHLYKEDKVLFPGALEAQRALRKAD